MGKKCGDWYHYSGAIHMHTTESDGAKSLEEVAAIGREVGLDFLMVTDHMGLTNRERGLEGFYGSTLVLIGYEHNDLEDNNHYLIFKSPSVYPENMGAKQYVAAAHRDGALGILAHPIENRSREGKYPPYPWTEWDTDLFDGLEIWNQMSEWMEKLTPWNKLPMALSPRKSMIGPPPGVLEIWDRLSRKRRYVGVAGVDAHAYPVKLGPLTVEIFPYKVHFRSLLTHIILDQPLASDFATASEQVYKALADCRVFNSNHRWGDAQEFHFSANDGSRTAVCGDAMTFREGITLSVELPSRAHIRLVGNGHQVADTHGTHLELKVREPGLYRAEVWKGRRGWIFSNHIRIGVD
ncbi:MAG: histidinol-phosphatase [Candidatus Zixiibacteriota bacterium]